MEGSRGPCPCRGRDLGHGTVDDLTDDGSIVWIVFGGAEPRRMFLEEGSAR
ncbi:hypothetical protein [Pseudarthrobacter sp. LT1]|uniref:hypothetical protein n=1 Tax=Pseudarthrobacter sp. LT1 TaxID=3111450 RepID=UPI002D77D652|nr:hypothetical protein [Pseudarthrobacter sp. LT1]WRT12481.1 hypothetical protein VIK36_14040 [Pseudarthrobacter sp. LT1]